MQNFHGEQELFDSDHLDTVHKNTILSKCRVLTLEAYEVREPDDKIGKILLSGFGLTILVDGNACMLVVSCDVDMLHSPGSFPDRPSICDNAVTLDVSRSVAAKCWSFPVYLSDPVQNVFPTPKSLCVSVYVCMCACDFACMLDASIAGAAHSGRARLLPPLQVQGAPMACVQQTTCKRMMQSVACACMQVYIYLLADVCTVQSFSSGMLKMCIHTLWATALHCMPKTCLVIEVRQACTCCHCMVIAPCLPLISFPLCLLLVSPFGQRESGGSSTFTTCYSARYDATSLFFHLSTYFPVHTCSRSPRSLSQTGYLCKCDFCSRQKGHVRLHNHAA